MAAAKESNTKVETKPKAEVKSEEKKPVTPREDPIARAKRQLEETIAKAKETAQKQLDKAREDLAASQRNVDKAVRVREERKARVERLEAHAQGNDAASYAAALGQTEVGVYDLGLTEVSVYDGSDESPAEADAAEDNES